MIGALAGLIAPYKLLLIAGAVFAALVTIGGSYYWMYSRGAAVERAICSSEKAAKDLEIAAASEKARLAQKARDDAALDIVADMLDATEKKLAEAKSRPAFNNAQACLLTEEDVRAFDNP